MYRAVAVSPAKLLYYIVLRTTSHNALMDGQLVDKLQENPLDPINFSILRDEVHQIGTYCYGSVKMCLSSTEEFTQQQLLELKNMVVTMKLNQNDVKLSVLDIDTSPIFRDVDDFIVVEDKWIVEELERDGTAPTDSRVEEVETVRTAVRLGNDEARDSILKLTQCSGTTKLGKQCKRHKKVTVMNWRCFQHK